MLIFCTGLIFGITIGIVLTAAIASSGNSTRAEEAYHIGFENGRTAAVQEIDKKLMDNNI